jgi:hypothetical protein
MQQRSSLHTKASDLEADMARTARTSVKKLKKTVGPVTGVSLEQYTVLHAVVL